jgi:hypothetical protein
MIITTGYYIDGYGLMLNVESETAIYPAVCVYNYLIFLTENVYY